MADYIDREAAIRDFETNGSNFVYGQNICNAIISRLKIVPAAEVVTWEWLQRYAHGRGMQYASGFVDEARKAWEAEDD